MLVAPGDLTLKEFVAVVTLLVAFAYIILWILFKVQMHGFIVISCAHVLCVVQFGILPCSLPPPFLQSDDAAASKAAGSSAPPPYDEEAPTASPDDTR